ncbi:envelope integrity protein Cei [Gordonia sp. (in: high G+C Gram-positive bacteria)]|uniref:envelope integrity protein Cei n=1 Tax=Gordonia sp. (in: high G+C Gram-positive bacteria) TaxID=84139 RepID=UPI0039E24BA6
MVASITNGYSKDHQGRPFRRRVPTPAIIAVAILAAAGVLVWSIALTRGASSRVPVDCNQPSAAAANPSGAPAPGGAKTGSATVPKLTAMNRDEMLEVSPAALPTFGVRVLNASNQRGKAQSVSDDLVAQGFSPPQDNAYGDDTVYPNKDLNCVGQIRFGEAGKASAAALWLAIPCAQLVMDGRSGTDVDLAIGQYFTGTEQSADAQAALEALRSADPRNPKTGVDPQLIKAVHSGTC